MMQHICRPPLRLFYSVATKTQLSGACGSIRD